MTGLADFMDRGPPDVAFRKPVYHPNKMNTVIGRIGFDEERSESVAGFPRTKDEHYFFKYAGYALSEQVLRRLREEDVGTVYIKETNNGRVIEYDRAAFHSGTLIAYSPTDETIVEGEAVERASAEFHDRQRVVPVAEARDIWNVREVDFHE